MNLRVRLPTGGRFCSAAPWAGVHPADLNQSGNLHSHLSKSGQTLEKNGLLRSPGGQQTEPPVGDVLHSSTEDRRFLSGLKRRQLGSLEFSPDGIARVLSFCPRWLRITPRKDLQTHDGHKGFRKLRTTFKAGRRWTAVPPSPRSCNRTRKGRYLDVDPHPDNRARGLGFHRFRIVTPQSIPTSQVTAISSNMKTTKGRRRRVVVSRVKGQSLDWALFICGYLHTLSLSFRLLSAGVDIKEIGVGMGARL